MPPQRWESLWIWGGLFRAPGDGHVIYIAADELDRHGDLDLAVANAAQLTTWILAKNFRPTGASFRRDHLGLLKSFGASTCSSSNNESRMIVAGLEHNGFYGRTPNPQL
jgi:hypothetical protein